MKIIFRRWFAKGKNRITRRLDKKKDTMTFRPTFSARNIQYEVSDKTHGITCGGIGAMHLLAQRIGLIDAIDEHLHLLKFHFPYHESDHVLNLAYNALCNGTCLQDIELRATTRTISTLSAHSAFPIPPRQAISVAASRSKTSIRSSTSSMTCV